MWNVKASADKVNMPSRTHFLSGYQAAHEDKLPSHKDMGLGVETLRWFYGTSALLETGGTLESVTPRFLPLEGSGQDSPGQDIRHLPIGNPLRPLLLISTRYGEEHCPSPGRQSPMTFS